MKTIAATLVLLAGCTTNPQTGKDELDTVTVFELLSLAGSLAEIAAGDTGLPTDVMDLAANGVEDGIAKYCALDPWDQDTVRRQLDARDLTLRPYLRARYGGADGDVCTLPADP